MCIAIYKPAGLEITKDTLQNCFDSNSDGCGFAYISTDHVGIRRLKIKKALTFDLFWQQYSRAIRTAPQSPFIIHFRIKTHGLVNIENCHPFRIDKDHAFIHNGIIRGMTYDKERSDTNRFNSDYLRTLPSSLLFHKGVLNMISHIIDMGKIVMLNVDGDVQICNEDRGKWDGGIWYSNDSYKARSYYSGNSVFGLQKQYGSYYKGGGTTVTEDKALTTTANGIAHYRKYERCTSCNSLEKVDELRFFYDNEEGVFQYCSHCVKRILKEFPDMKGYEVSLKCFEEFAKQRVGSFDTLYYPVTLGYKEEKGDKGVIEAEIVGATQVTGDFDWSTENQDAFLYN